MLHRVDGVGILPLDEALLSARHERQHVANGRIDLPRVEAERAQGEARGEQQREPQRVRAAPEDDRADQRERARDQHWKRRRVSGQDGQPLHVHARGEVQQEAECEPQAELLVRAWPAALLAQQRAAERERPCGHERGQQPILLERERRRRLKRRQAELGGEQPAQRDPSHVGAEREHGGAEQPAARARPRLREQGGATWAELREPKQPEKQCEIEHAVEQGLREYPADPLEDDGQWHQPQREPAERVCECSAGVPHHRAGRLWSQVRCYATELAAAP
jgi:hypothetical protein